MSIEEIELTEKDIESMIKEKYKHFNITDFYFTYKNSFFELINHTHKVTSLSGARLKVEMKTEY